MPKSFEELKDIQFSFWTVIAKSDKPGYVKCKCKCGTVRDVYIDSLIKGKSTSCSCSNRGKANTALSQRHLENAKKYIGQTKNGLKILDVRMVFKPHRNHIEFQCECPCGNIFWTRKNGVLSNKIFSCGHDTTENLKRGHEKGLEMRIDGTFIKAIDGTRKKNKNNSTGMIGVSLTSNGKYKAYINFKGKNYHLGTFEELDKAAKARKAAEKEIFGKFLEWYESRKEN